MTGRSASLVKPLRGAVVAALQHDVLTLAQAAAYASMVAIFPTLIVAAAVVGLLPDATPLRVQMSLFFDRVLPPNVSSLLGSYFVVRHHNPHTSRALWGSVVVALTGSAGVMSTLMEGFRRAHELPLPAGSFWPRRLRAVLLVPISLLPMSAATALVMFGHVLTHWLVGEVAMGVRPAVRVGAFLLRWTLALAGSTGILAVIYHLGTDVSVQMRDQLEPLVRDPLQAFRRDWSWRASLPGAMLATALWFVTTLLFGFYVTRFANYGQVYGSLGAGIALLVWLFLIAVSVLMGAEFNAQVARRGARF
jgi:membrane protein